MAVAKFLTFDSEKIRMYMETNSEVLNQGIKYFQARNPSLGRELAKESAIRYAQEKCATIWKNDSTGYIDSEYKAFERFAEKVKKGFEFDSTPPKSFGSLIGEKVKTMFLGGIVIAVIYGIIALIGILTGNIPTN